MRYYPWAAVLIALSACAPQAGQSRYNYNEVGQSAIVEFATVVAANPVDITGRNTGGGTLAGAGIGGGAGAYAGSGSGTLWTAAGGAVLGGIAGTAAEQLAADRKGMEYVIVTENKKTKTIVQNLNAGDALFKPGDRVMLQTKGTYQRLLPTDNLPEQIKRPHGIDIVE